MAMQPEQLVAKALVLLGYGPEARAALTEELAKGLSRIKSMEANVSRMASQMAELHAALGNPPDAPPAAVAPPPPPAAPAAAAKARTAKPRSR